MTQQPRIPDPETSKRLLTSLRKARLEVQEVSLELEEVSAKFEQELREQKLQRVKRSLSQF